MNEGDGEDIKDNFRREIGEGRVGRNMADGKGAKPRSADRGTQRLYGHGGRGQVWNELATPYLRVCRLTASIGYIGINRPRTHRIQLRGAYLIMM